MKNPVSGRTRGVPAADVPAWFGTEVRATTGFGRPMLAQPNVPAANAPAWFGTEARATTGFGRPMPAQPKAARAAGVS